MRNGALGTWCGGFFALTVLFAIFAGISGSVLWIVLCSLVGAATIIMFIILISPSIENRLSSKRKKAGRKISTIKDVDAAIVEEGIAGISVKIETFCKKALTGDIDYSLLEEIGGFYGVFSPCLKSATQSQIKDLAELQRIYASVIISEPIYTPAFGLHFYPDIPFLFADFDFFKRRPTETKEKMDRAIICLNRHSQSCNEDDLKEANTLLVGVKEKLDESDELMLARWYALVHRNSDEIERAYKKALEDEDDE